MFDMNWKKILVEQGISTWLLARYMDDARAFLQPFQPGWRYSSRGLEYCLRWATEDEDLTATERTKRILAGTMKGVEQFLEFTFETCEDDEFQGWLPTLDSKFRVEDNNQVSYMHYEKDTCSRRTIQTRTAMNENSKMQILANDMIRRLLTTKEDLGADVKGAVVDQYATKLLHSGYTREQTRKILKNGIKGYIGRKKNRERAGKKLRSTANESRSSRYMKKLLGKTSWYRKKGRNNENTQEQEEGSRKGTKAKSKEQKKRGEQEQEHKTVMFVEFTKNGELAGNLRELTGRMATTLGFKVKIVERTGTSLKNMFSTTNLWGEQKCGRADCITCEQGAEMIPNCTQASLVYENVCGSCNPTAGEKKELREVRQDIPTLYVGETSRSIFERSREHWGALRSRSDKSHMWKHQEEHHGGEAVRFYMRVVGFYKTALSRQIGEAVRIDRRGGAGSILNSKSEYDRCRIPRLVLEEQDMEKLIEEEEQEITANCKIVEEQTSMWGSRKYKEREQEDRVARNSLPKITGTVKSYKREQEEERGSRKKKIKYMKEPDNWGEANELEWLAGEQNQSSQLSPSLPKPDWEQPPLEQIIRPKRSRQLTLSELLRAQAGAPKGEPPEPAGYDIEPEQEPSLPEEDEQFEEHTNVKDQAPPTAEMIDDQDTSTRDDRRARSPPTVKENNKKSQVLTTPSIKMKVQKVMISNVIGEMSDQDQAVSNDDVLKDNEMIKCDFTKDGVCNIHGLKATKLRIPTKKWAAKRGGGFGWKTIKVIRFLCKARNNAPAEPEIPTSVKSDDSQERFLEFSGDNSLGD